MLRSPKKTKYSETRPKTPEMLKQQNTKGNPNETKTAKTNREKENSQKRKRRKC